MPTVKQVVVKSGIAYTREDLIEIGLMVLNRANVDGIKPKKTFSLEKYGAQIRPRKYRVNKYPASFTPAIEQKVIHYFTVIKPQKNESADSPTTSTGK